MMNYTLIKLKYMCKIEFNIEAAAMQFVDKAVKDPNK